jgi:hypothetical protein
VKRVSRRAGRANQPPPEPASHSDRVSGLYGGGVGVLAGIVYLATAARDIVVGDTGDFLTTGATLGVAHPPGYPLLVLLGHLFSLLPIGPLPFRMNLVAAFSHAVTVALVFSIARRLGAARSAALIAALALAFNPLFWEWSLAIEAFPLNDLLAASLIYFLVRWEAEPERPAFFIAAALCGGLGAANHLTIVFLIPFVLVVAWRRRASIKVGTLIACVGAVAFGLLPYSYIPWAASRHPFLNWGSIASAHDLLRHFLRSDYGTGRLVAAGAASGSPIERLISFGASFTILETTLVLLGAVVSFRRLKWYFWASALSFAVAGPAFVAYANIDVTNTPLLWALRRFFLLPHLIVAPLAAFGVVRLVDILAPRTIRVRRHGVELAVAATALALIVVPAAVRYPILDQSRNHLAHTFAQDVLASLEPNTVVMALGDEAVFPIAYVQAVERARPDVTLVMLGLFRSFGWYVRELRWRNPSLNIPFERYDPGDPGATLRALVAANPARPFALVGPPTDASLATSYWLYRRGVVEQIEPLAKDIGLDEAAQENDRLLRIYHLPEAANVRKNTFEIGILAKYVKSPASMGDQFALAHLDRQAELWYARALSIDPDAADVRRALAKIRTKIP